MNVPAVIMAIQYVAIAVLFIELVFAAMQKPSKMQVHIVVLDIACILMIVGYLIELNSVNIEEALAGTAVSYIGKPFIMLSSFMFITSYFRFKIPDRILVLLSCFCILFPIIVFTNEYHHLYYATQAFDLSAGYTPLILTRGPLYYTYVFSTIIFFIACIYIIYKGTLQAKTKAARRPSFYMLMMVVSAISGYVIYLLGLTDGYDSTVLGVCIGVFFLSVLFFRFKIFDVVSVGKNMALEDSSVGIVVFDQNDEVAYTNNAFDSLISDIFTIDSIREISKERNKFSMNNRMFSITKKEILSSGKHVGETLEIADITDTFNYQSRLESEVKERTERIENIQRSIIASMANIVEARSTETGEHIKRTTEYTSIIANALQKRGYYPNLLSDEYVRNLVSAAPLHDIGKLAVSDTILLKPTRLTPEEFEKMKLHVTAGVDIIESTMRGLESEEYIKTAQDVAKYHHERWDGGGYPEGLSGADIPLSARIVAIADSFDAIVSKRCYKDASNEEEAHNT